MQTVAAFAVICLPPFFAFGLILVSRPPWAGGVMWLCSVGIVVAVWVWALGTIAHEGRYFAYAIAIWLTWPPVLALVVWLRRRFRRNPMS